MDKRIKERLYSELATIAADDGGRLQSYLAGASTAERQARYKQQRKAEGKRRAYVWIHRDKEAELKRLYPGERGGVDWDAVIDAAIRGGNV